MAAYRKALILAAQSAVGGLAIAFLVVLARPELASLQRVPSAGGVASYAEAVAASSPAVVNIYTERSYNLPGNPTGLTLRGRALGSGVVISPEGYVVTNWHVISGADRIRVQLADGRVAIPTLVGEDPETELALLHVDLDDLPTIELGRSDSLAVGEVVLAIGNSLGLSHTVTMGIVSATGRGQLGVTTFEDFIQTDAAINVGNSGGALINTRGELVGINTAVIGTGRGGRAPPEGIGFAIPVNLVRGVMDQLIRHGRVIRGYLGVDAENLPAAYARTIGVEGPALYLRCVHGSAAAAGLRRGDVLTHVNGERVLNRQQAMNIVASAQPGDRLRIQVARPGGTFTTEAILEERALQDTGGGCAG